MSYEAVLSYYEIEFKKYFSESAGRRMSFKSESRIGYVYLGSRYLEGLSKSNLENAISVQAINQDAPDAVIDAFERHIWYSKHSLTDVFAFKISLDQVITFAICINGYVGDAWDNGCAFIEIYGDKGDFIDAAEVSSVDSEYEFDWLGCQIKGYELCIIAPPSPFEDSEDYSYMVHLSRDQGLRVPMWDINSFSGEAKIIPANLFVLPESMPYKREELAFQNLLSEEEIEYVKTNYFRFGSVDLHDAIKFYRRSKRVSSFEAREVMLRLFEKVKEEWA